ncbi:hypothetical protein C8Q78DRAFT_986039 [Trametes maxima]|nr:hypothetical protein C8Q78DRAFT_986039 [Trametes maxima]
MPAKAQKTKLCSLLVRTSLLVDSAVSDHLNQGNAINDAAVCPGFTFVSAYSKCDKYSGSTHVTECGLYRRHRAPRSILDERGQPILPLSTDWSTIELSIVSKTHSNLRDPFEKNPALPNPAAILRKETFGQVLSYAQFVFAHQHRTCHFMVLFLGDQCRILRFDRSGIFATAKFNYKTDGEPLVEFLWRFAHLSPAERGIDVTAEEVARDSELAKSMSDRAKIGTDDYARERFAASLEPAWPWYLLHLTDERTGRKRRFLVGKPHFTAFGVAGRGTRSYVAVDADNISGPFVHLKDAWRVVHDEIDKEGTILEQLNKESVPFIPTLLCHGDLGQHTLSLKLWRKYHPDVPEDQMCPVKQHTHYRLVVKEVGKPLSEFKDGRELVFAMFCCLKAHAKAYKAGIIHRDISFGNILLFPRKGAWVGLLNDWELSKKVNSKYPQGRQPDRTGTWQFLSANALVKPTKHIVVQDELESFFHVVLYTALRFLPHNCLDADVGRLLYDYFDAHQKTQKGYSCGQMKLASMRNGQISFVQGDQTTEIRFFASPKSSQEHPLNALLGELLTSASPWTASRPSYRGKISSRSSSLNRKWPSPRTFPQICGSSIAPPSAPILRSTKSHPINDIVDELLIWFKSHYTLTFRSHNPVKQDAGNSSRESSPTRRPRMPKKTWATKKRAKALGTSGNVVKASKSTLSSTTDNLDADKENAAKLENHLAIAALFEEYLDEAQHAWPKDDKVEDQRPKGGYKRGQDVLRGQTSYQNQPTSSLSVKRGVEAVEAPEPPSTPKHRRVEEFTDSD